MRGSRRRDRRLRRAGATFSLIGLVMTVFLAIGQVGLIAANADGWSDRSGDGSASTESGGRGDGFTKTVDSTRVTTRQSNSKPVTTAAVGQTDALNVNLDQYANEDAEWQNGNLNGNNSQYAEGDVVPFRLAIEGLTAGSHTIHINYDFTAGGHEAYDFLATWDVTENPGLCDVGGGGVSSMCPGLGAADTEPFPSDTFAPGGTTQAGLTVSGAESFAGVSRQLTMYGGTITGITGPVHSGVTTGNSTGDFTVTFDSTGSAVLLAWGGHLAQSAYWKTTGGDPNGAAEVSGAPWHMRTQQLDGSGNKNQDRSIQPSAIYSPTVEISKEVVDATGAPITEVSPGESFTYQILVTNGGNADATGVVVTDDLDDALTVDSADWEITGGSPSACDVGAGNTIRCPAGSGTATIPAGDAMLVEIDVTAPDTCGPLVNTAHVDWSEDATDTGLDSNQVTIDVTGCAPDLSIDKEAVDEAGAPVTEVSPGDSFSYVITVTNDGNADATDVVVTDDLDDTLTIDAASYAIGGGASSDCDIDAGNAIRCPQDPGTETLQPGESMVVTVDVTTAPDVCGALMNTAHVDWAEDGSGEGLDSNLVTVDVIGCAPDLTIEKTGPATVGFGEQVTYEITVENVGNAATAGSVVITDSVPSELSNVDATYSFNGGADQNCDVTGNDVSCDVGVMEPGDSVVVTITADAPSDSCPSFTNQAFVGDLGSNEVDTDVTGCAPDLELHKTGPATAEVGGLVTYTVTVANNGNAATADSVIVTDAVDSDLSGVTASFSLNGGPDQDCDVTGNDVSCDLGILQPGDSAEITISGTTPTDICPEIVNQAFIGQLGSEIVTTTIDCPPPGIDLVKDGDDMAHVGDTVTYTFDVSLTPDSLPLTNVTLTDPICDSAPTGPTGDDGDAVLEQGEVWHYTCTHVVTESDPDPLPNTATASGWFGETEVTDEDSHEVDIIHPAIEIVKQARPRSGSPGEQVTYHYTITNIGDVVLTNISVDDDVIGHICDIAELQPNESTECTKDFTLPDDGTIKVTNVGTAEGEDPLGETVKDDDTETVDVILGQTITKTPPGPIAFTGTSSVIPLGALLLVFVTAGSALLWVGRRRGRQTSTE